MLKYTTFNYISDKYLFLVKVDLQKMQVSCDADQAFSEGCCELSSMVSQLPRVWALALFCLSFQLFVSLFSSA